jgi:hypothetical protein
MYKKTKRVAILLPLILTMLLPAHVGAVGTTAADILNQVGDNIDAGAENSVPREFSNDGLYGCAGGQYGSIGKAHAGGVFVPVSEEAIALNTNILLYKECILDGVIARIRESMVAFMVKSTINAVNQGADGGSSFIQDQQKFRLDTAEAVVEEFTTGEKTEGLASAFKEQVREGLQSNYAQVTRKPESAYAHSVPEEKEAEFNQFLNGGAQFSWDMYLLSIQPENNPIGAYSLALGQMLTEVDEKINDEYRELDWGQGFKSQKNCKKIPVGNGVYEESCEIVTPGATLKNIIDYVSLTGHRQTENADEVDELMGSLMSNIHTQIITSVGGLRGLSQSNSSSGGAYLDQIAGDASTRTRTEYTDVGVNFLASAVATETAYGAARKASSKTLGEAASRVQIKEDACWDALIEQAKQDLIAEARGLACALIPQQQQGGFDNTTNQCSIQGSATVVHATSTEPYITGQPEYHDVTITAKAGSKTVSRTLVQHTENSVKKIAENVSPLLRIVNQSIVDSDRALSILATLQTNLLASNTPGNTRFILGQVDQLVEARALHKEADIYSAQTQHDQIVETMEQFYDETSEDWGLSWCNPSNWRDQIKE